MCVFHDACTLTRCPSLPSCLAQHPDEAQFEEAGAMNVFFYLQRVRAGLTGSRMCTQQSNLTQAARFAQTAGLHAVEPSLACLARLQPCPTFLLNHPPPALPPALQRDGTRVLATPPLAGTILPGVTRDSILQLARHWGEEVGEVEERPVTIAELREVSVGMDHHLAPFCMSEGKTGRSAGPRRCSTQHATPAVQLRR